jgi:tRNA dimethylallyltransferase
MTSRSTPGAIVITGPTGVGKTELAVELAEKIGGSIVSADSRQVYREMSIGTAKPGSHTRQRVAHAGLDILDPDQSYNAGRFARDAWAWIEGIRAAGGVPIIVGGTGFFIRALLEPLGPEPRLEEERRDALRRYFSQLAATELKRWLARLDPKRAAQLSDEGGRQRLSRALEVALLSGQPHSWWLEGAPPTEALEALVVCLELPRDSLNRRIEERFDAMMDDGLLEEVRGLLDRYPEDAPGLDSVGYAELVDHLLGRRALEDAVELAKRNTRRFAKRQMTWFRHQLPKGTLWLDGTRPRGELVREIAVAWEGWGTRLAKRGTGE